MAQPFTLKLARSKLTLEVGPDESALDVLVAHGVDIISSCCQGVCGSCLTVVLEGQPDHQDMYLTPEEQAAGNCFTPCCSRAVSDTLVIDL